MQRVMDGIECATGKNNVVSWQVEGALTPILWGRWGRKYLKNGKNILLLIMDLEKTNVTKDWHVINADAKSVWCLR